MLPGQMMNMPLTITSIMNFADRVHGDSEIVSITAENPRHRYTYSDAFKRTRQLANALAAADIGESDRIGTLAWNDYRHFELYYAISCSGAVCHTINPRLFPEQIEYIVNHAEDRMIFVDPAFVPLLEDMQEKLPKVEQFVVLTDATHMPQTSLKNVQDYESFIAGHPDTFEWPELDENAASALCYTSGTTGNPKGVLYSHRSTVLHSYTAGMPDAMAISIKDTVLPVVPMFHVNAWGLPYGAVMVGAKLIFPGGATGDGETLHDLIVSEGVTMSAGVPTIWLILLRYLRETGKRIDGMQRVMIGGSACPLGIMDEFEKYGVNTHQVWGMTETGPLAVLNTLKPGMENLSKDKLDAVRLKQGRPVFGIDLRIVDDEGEVLPWDGESSGNVRVKGNWVCSSYFRLDNNKSHDEDGYLDTGDIACMDVDGYMRITDRAKDVIKSGGEWVSSIDLENAAMGHSGVAEAAVIGVPHPQWSERPLLIIVRADDADLNKDEMLAHLEGKVAKWWIPEDVVFVDEIPHTATGKVSKKDLRSQFVDFQSASVK